jgi:hypothetical protein
MTPVRRSLTELAQEGTGALVAEFCSVAEEVAETHERLGQDRLLEAQAYWVSWAKTDPDKPTSLRTKEAEAASSKMSMLVLESSTHLEALRVRWETLRSVINVQMKEVCS